MSPVGLHSPSKPLTAKRADHGMASLGWLVFPLLLAAGLVLRVLVMRSTWGQPDSDEATGMIMALRASQGHLSLLFWGGNYGGAGITWVEAPLILLFGFHFWIFWVVDTLVTLIGVLVFWRIARRLLSPLAAAAAGGTFWCFPATWVYWSGREYVFWLPAIALAMATNLFVLRWFESRSKLNAGAIGLGAGLSLWCYPLVLPLIAPAVVVFVWAERRNLRQLVQPSVLGLVGISPWIAYFAIHSSSAFAVQTTTEGRVTTAHYALTQALATALIGGQKRVGVIWGGPDASRSHLALLGLVILVVEIICAIVFIVRRNVAMAACAFSFLLWPPTLVLGHVLVTDATFRYGLIPIAPLLLLGAYLLSQIRASVVLAVGALVLVGFTTWNDTSGLASAPSCNPSLILANQHVMALGRHAAWASYWLASDLQVCSGQQLQVASVTPVRDVHAESRAANAAKSTYVVFAGNQLDTEITGWTNAHHGVAVDRSLAGGYAVWAFDGVVTPKDMDLQGAF